MPSEFARKESYGAALPCFGRVIRTQHALHTLKTKGVVRALFFQTTFIVMLILMLTVFAKT